MPLFVCALWTALTSLAPLAAVHLLARSRLGVMLTAAIAIAIATGDVVLNAWGGASRGFQVDAFIAASLLLIFVLTAAGLACPQRRPSGLSANVLTVSFPPAAKEP